ncbi:reverse transcriptase domain-containing protein [Tanacetum coccineum]
MPTTITRWFEKLESQFRISNVAEGDQVKFSSSTLDGALTWWNVYVRSVTLDTAHATPWSDFKAMFIRKYYPRNEVKQMENELWNLKVRGTNLTAYNQHFQELILLCPEMVPKADRLLECYIEGLPLNIKGNVTSSKPVDLHEAIEMAQAKEDLEAKKDMEVMSLISDVAKKDITRSSARTMGVKAVEIRYEATNKIIRTIKGRIKEILREITKHQPALKEGAEHLAEYTAYVLKLR